ncbi:CAMK/CAMKL/MARK protein kinase [Capsaspora owczarzaki ATCC 30864]|uniref:CAMK/CAMKL/MARK protein kinase n=1 Tax=Capsaspora owczarzaki (strain ATCC 30864) TaxID=595528 RepID=A0A0D2VND2_CAPO3|nr:CAMK/CAMKL/MARK protein kinase [Capsaspora owczarzaki ATCC 30864]
MGGCLSADKTAFRQLDRGNKGYLTLDDLARGTSRTPWPTEADCSTAAQADLPEHFFVSPALLFLFDTKRAGRLGMSEFCNLLGHVRAATKYVALHQSHPSSLASGSTQTKYLPRRFRAAALQFDGFSRRPQEFALLEEHTIRHHQRHPTRLVFDREAAARVHGEHSASSNQAVLVPMCTRYSTDNESEDQPRSSVGGPSNALDAQIRHLILSEPARYLRQFLRTDDGREAFVSWLVRLVHYEQSPTISTNALQHLILALNNDGISIGDLGLIHAMQIPLGMPSARQTRSLVQQLGPSQLVLFAFGRDEGRLATAIPGPATASLDALTVSLPLELTQAAFLLFADHLTAEYRSVSVADPHDEAKILGDYKLMETVGYGAEGVVKRAIHQPTGTERAIKVIEKGNVAQMSKVDVQIKAMELLTHPNIIALLQVLESETDIFLVLEHCDQSLYDVVAHRGRGLPEDEIRPLFRRLILAIQYSHSVGVCHRDLRVENLLLTQDGVLKVADFGHAGVFAEGWDMFSTTLVGSVQYISPEQIHGKCYSGQLIDMWACGIILYFLAVGRLPFDSRAHSDNMHAFLDDVLSARYSFPTSVSHDLQNLISRLLMTNAEERATPADVLAHPWMAVDAAIDSSKSESLQE